MSEGLYQNIAVLGVVGTGIMGRGIAQTAAQGGLQVRMFDAQAGAAARARESIADTLARLVERGRIDAAARAATLDRLTVVDGLAQMAGCQAVVEAIVEQLEPKQALFTALEGLVDDHCILATNTSSLSVTAIAARCRRPQRVAGFHFFNPVPLMKVVEVVDGMLTDAGACEALAELARRVGHTPVRAADTPGFIVNHAGRAYGTEALQMLREGVAAFHDIDRILCDAAGFRMGPFELLDLTGLDVSHAVMESIYNQYYQEPRYRPSPIASQRVAAGLFGRKSGGRGFYRYEGGTRQDPAPAAAPAAAVPPVWISRRGEGDALRTTAAALSAPLESGDRPSPRALILIAPLGEDATTATLAEGLDATRTVAVDALFDLARRRTLMTTPVTAPAWRDAAHALFARDGVAVTVIRDSAGFVAQRVVAHVVNIGCDIAQQGIASPADIDRAVTLGLGYPRGPLAWGDALGPPRVLAILDAIYAGCRDPRYRASPWLRRRAALGVSLLTREH